jgi:16S rRNA (uracil1498-N3)-methyltransferase
VFVDDLESPALIAEDRHHLERVLRLRPGEAVTVSDGRGGWRLCRYTPGSLVADGDIEQSPPLFPSLTIGFALTKGDRPEWVIQKLTEVGIDEIVPFVTHRTVVRLDGEKGRRRLDRLRAVARGAAMQSRRVWLPAVHDLAPFAAVVAQLGPSAAMAHPGSSGRVSLDRPAILVGPEGGFTPEELAADLPLVDLGPGILRAETAALASGVLLAGLRSGVIHPAG